MKTTYLLLPKTPPVGYRLSDIGVSNRHQSFRVMLTIEQNWNREPDLRGCRFKIGSDQLGSIGLVIMLYHRPKHLQPPTHRHALRFKPVQFLACAHEGLCRPTVDLDKLEH